jgi:hypothetical protein
MITCAICWMKYCIPKNTYHQQMRKEGFVINRNTLLHVSTLLGHLQGEHHQGLYLSLHIKSIRFVVGLNNISRTHYQENGPDRRQFTPPKATQYTVNSTFSLNYKV